MKASAGKWIECGNGSAIWGTACFPSLTPLSPSLSLSLPSCEEEVALWEGGGWWWVSIDTWFCITVCVSAPPLPPAEPQLVVSAPAKLLLCFAQQAGSDLCMRPPERRRRRGACRDLSPPLYLTPACAVLLLQRSDLAGLPTQTCSSFSFLALNRCRLLLLFPLWWDIKYRCIETWTVTGHRYRPEQTIPTSDFLQSVNVKSLDFFSLSTLHWFFFASTFHNVHAQTLCDVTWGAGIYPHTGDDSPSQPSAGSALWDHLVAALVFVPFVHKRKDLARHLF